MHTPRSRLKWIPLVATLLALCACKGFRSGGEDGSLPELLLTRDDAISSVTSCEAFLATIPDHEIVEEVNNMRIASDYQECLSGSILSRLEPPERSEYAGNFGDVVVSQLALGSFPSSIRPRLEADDATFASIGMTASAVSAETVEIDEEDWLYRFSLRGRGDVDRDGSEELVVAFVDQAKAGDYFSTQILILKRSSSDPLWVGVDGVDFIRATR